MWPTSISACERSKKRRSVGLLRRGRPRQRRALPSPRAETSRLQGGGSAAAVAVMGDTTDAGDVISTAAGVLTLHSCLSLFSFKTKALHSEKFCGSRTAGELKCSASRETLVSATMSGLTFSCLHVPPSEKGCCESYSIRVYHSFMVGFAPLTSGGSQKYPAFTEGTRQMWYSRTPCAPMIHYTVPTYREKKWILKIFG